MAEIKLEITKDTVIGDLLQNYPEAQKVIEKHFGQGCFTCPGIKMESLEFGVMMHGLDVKNILEELQEVCS